MLLLQTLPQRQQAIRCSYNEEQEFSETSRSKLIQAARLPDHFLVDRLKCKNIVGGTITHNSFGAAIVFWERCPALILRPLYTSQHLWSTCMPTLLPTNVDSCGHFVKRQQMLGTFVAFVNVRKYTKSFDMDEIETITFFGAAYLVFYLMKQVQKGRKKKRTTWGRRWIRNRDKSGAYKGVIEEVKTDDSTSFRTLMRMDEESFNFLLEKVSPLIKRQDTNMRQAISPGERLSLTLRFLATGR